MSESESVSRDRGRRFHLWCLPDRWRVNAFTYMQGTFTLLRVSNADRGKLSGEGQGSDISRFGPREIWNTTFYYVLLRFITFYYVLLGFYYVFLRLFH